MHPTEQHPDPTYPWSPDNRDSASLGYVIVPAGHDPQAYVRQALDTGRLSIVTDRGEFLHRVVCARHVLKEINQLGWPQDVDELGPCVLLANLPIHNQLVAVATIVGAGEVSGLSDQHETGLLLRQGTSFVALRARADAGSVALSLHGEGEQQSQLSLRLTHPDQKAQQLGYVQGDTVHRSEGLSQLEAGQRLLLRVGAQGSSDDSQGQMELEYVRGTGLRYLDEWGNEFTCNKKGVTLRRKGEHRTVALTEAGINLGSEQGAEPAVLGQTNLTLIDELIDLILKAQYLSPMGGYTAPGPLNVVEFTTLKEKFKSTLSQHVRLD